MPTFTPPTAQNYSLDLPDVPDRMDPLWKRISAPPRGLNVLKYTDGTYEQVDAFPWITDGVGKTVAVAYYGGHSYTVSSAEAALLTAAGYGGSIT